MVGICKYMGGWDYWTYYNQPVAFLKGIEQYIENEYFERKRQEMKGK